MKFLLFVLALICLGFVVSAQPATLFLDDFQTEIDDFKPTQDVQATTYSHSGAAGQDVYVQIVKQILDQDEATFRVDMGSLIFSSPARALSDMRMIWAADANVVYPCAANQDLDVCTTNPLASGPGLDLDISAYGSIAIAVTFKDIAGPVEYGFRMWFNNGQTAFVKKTYTPTNLDNATPLLVFPLAEFGSSFLTSTVQAVSFSINVISTDSLDQILGPIQFLGTTMEKTTTTSNLSPSGSLTYNVDVAFSQYQSPGSDVVDPAASYDKSLVLTDTLDAAFDAASVPVVTVTDNTNAQRTLAANITRNGNQFSLAMEKITVNDVSVNIRYSTSVGPTATTCQDDLCNSAQLTVDTARTDDASSLGQETFSSQVCVPFTSSPVLGVQLDACPTFSANPVVTSTISNTGVGPANNVVFTHSNLNAQQCTVSGVTVDGNAQAVNNVGDNLSFTLATLAAGASANVAVTYDCSAVAQVCGSFDFPVTTTANDDCTQNLLSQSCSFSTSSAPILGVQVDACPAFSANPVVTSTVSNTGDAPANNVVVTHSNLNAQQCTVSGVTVDGNAQAFTESASDLTFTLASVAINGQAQVAVTYDCSALVNKCGAFNFPVVVTANEDCVAALQTDSSCSFSTSASAVFNVSEIVTTTGEAKIGDSITFQITATNNGPAIPETSTLTKVYEQHVEPNAATQADWSCDLQTRTCTKEYTNLAANVPQVETFTVVVLDTFPTGPNGETCNVVTFQATNPQGCSNAPTDAKCAPVNPGVPGIAVTKAAFTSEYTFTITYTSEGTGAVNDLVLHETLQQGWSLSQKSKADGWVCSSTSCEYAVSDPVPVGQTGTVEFVVDVTEASQLNNDKCWDNQVSTSFTDAEFDQNLANNVAGVIIGSKCEACCEPSCPDPTMEIVVPCPLNVTCEYNVPEYHCPPCQVNPPSCSCDQCSNANNVVFGQVNMKKKKN